MEIVQEHYPQSSDLDSELPHLSEAIKTNLDEINQKIQCLSNSIKDILFLYSLNACCCLNFHQVIFLNVFFLQCTKLAEIFKDTKDRFDLIISPFLRQGQLIEL